MKSWQPGIREHVATRWVGARQTSTPASAPDPTLRDMPVLEHRATLVNVERRSQDPHPLRRRHRRPRRRRRRRRPRGGASAWAIRRVDVAPQMSPMAIVKLADGDSERRRRSSTRQAGTMSQPLRCGCASKQLHTEWVLQRPALETSQAGARWIVASLCTLCSNKVMLSASCFPALAMRTHALCMCHLC